jgi:hypothetical protein
MVIGPLFSDAEPFAEGLAAVELDYSWGYIDATGEVVIEPQFEWAERFSKGLARVGVQGSRLDSFGAYINTAGEYLWLSPDIPSDVLRPKIDFGGRFFEGLAAVSINRKYGYVDTTGQLVIEPRFNRAFSFSEGLAVVKIYNRWGYIDPAGELTIESRFDAAFSFAEGLAAVKVDDKWGYIDPTGWMVIEPQFDGASSFSEGLAAVEVDAKRGYIDPTGTVAIEPQFDDASPFFKGLAAVKVEDKWGFIDPTGTVAIEPQFDDASPFFKGLAAVKVGDPWGYIDPTGEVVIEPQFEWADRFSEGLALVRVDGKYGYIDPTGEAVIELQFDGALPFFEGLAWVAVGNVLDFEWAIIDTTGQFVWRSPDMPSEDEMAILSTFEDYRSALLAADGQGALELVDSMTVQWYTDILADALTMPREKLDDLTFFEKYMVLRIRHGLSQEALEAMTGQELFVTAVAQGWIDSSSLEDIQLGRTQVQADEADEAWLSLEQAPDVPVFHFVKENEQWKFALCRTFEQVNAVFEQEVAESGYSEDRFIKILLERASDSRVDERIFDGPISTAAPSQ